MVALFGSQALLKYRMLQYHFCVDFVFIFLTRKVFCVLYIADVVVCGFEDEAEESEPSVKHEKT